MKEFYRFKIWLNKDGELLMALCSWDVWKSMDFNNGFLHTFKGQQATVAVFTDDAEITREMKLKAAKAWMDGNYKTIEVDLNKCVGIETPGTPH